MLFLMIGVGEVLVLLLIGIFGLMVAGGLVLLTVLLSRRGNPQPSLESRLSALEQEVRELKAKVNSGSQP